MKLILCALTIAVLASCSLFKEPTCDIPSPYRNTGTCKTELGVGESCSCQVAGMAYCQYECQKAK